MCDRIIHATVCDNDEEAQVVGGGNLQPIGEIDSDRTGARAADAGAQMGEFAAAGSVADHIIRGARPRRHRHGLPRAVLSARSARSR